MERLPADFVRPAYGDGSILELPPTIGRLLGAPEGWASSPLALCAALGGASSCERLVLILLDGLGWHRWDAAPSASVGALREHATGNGGGAWTLTSVAPSTTSVATTSLLGNGAAPLEHGLLGYTARLASLGLVANLLFWKPEHGPGGVGSLEDWGERPETFLAHPSMFEVLARQGVTSEVLLPANIARSPLSRAQMRGVTVTGYVNTTDALSRLRASVQPDGGRKLSYLYIPDLDTLSHRDGPDAPVGAAVLAALCEQLASWLDAVAADGAAGETLVLVTADHGHAATPAESAYALADAPELSRLLACPPAGEPRHVFLHARTGAVDELLDGCRNRFGEDFAILTGRDAMDEGIYGPPLRAHRDAASRIGDVVMLARGGATFWRQRPDTLPLGMHGSLEAVEMRVPLLAYRV